MTIRLSLAFLISVSSIFFQPGKTNFSGRWQFDEAQSTSNQATRVIKDIPARLQAKIPSHDTPRLAPLPRFFVEPPVVVTKHVGSRLTISAPSWFTDWLGWNTHLSRHCKWTDFCSRRLSRDTHRA